MAQNDNDSSLEQLLAQARDLSTTPAQLQQIATAAPQSPELAGLLLVHPNMYPELAAWLQPFAPQDSEQQRSPAAVIAPTAAGASAASSTGIALTQATATAQGAAETAVAGSAPAQTALAHTSITAAKASAVSAGKLTAVKAGGIGAGKLTAILAGTAVAAAGVTAGGWYGYQALTSNDQPAVSAQAVTSDSPSPTAVTATEVIPYSPIDAEGQLKEGFVLAGSGKADLECSEYGVVAEGAYLSCSTTADSLRACWGTPGSYTGYCLRAFDDQVYQMTFPSPLPSLSQKTLASDAEEDAFALELENGDTCIPRLGGAVSSSSDGWTPGYYCDSGMIVFNNDTEVHSVNDSDDLWVANYTTAFNASGKANVQQVKVVKAYIPGSPTDPDTQP